MVRRELIVLGILRRSKLYNTFDLVCKVLTDQMDQESVREIHT